MLTQLVHDVHTILIRYTHCHYAFIVTQLISYAIIINDNITAIDFLRLAIDINIDIATGHMPLPQSAIDG